MNQIDSYFFYILLSCFLIFFTILVIKYVIYWSQLKKAYLHLSMTWPFPSQKELHEKGKKDFISTVFSIYAAPVRALHMIFMRTDNEILRNPLRGIRRCFLALILFPFFLIIVAIIVASF